MKRNPNDLTAYFRRATLRVRALRSIPRTGLRAPLSLVLCGVLVISLAVAHAAPPALRALDVQPPDSIGGCDSVTGSVTLAEAAPTGGAVVSLASSNPVVTVPSTVTVPSSSTTAGFKVTTQAVTAVQTASVTASFGGVSRSRTLSVRPDQIASLSVSPNPVGARLTATGIVTLECPAGLAGLVVTLDASDPTVASPTVASFTIPSGQLRGTFPIRAANVAQKQTTVIQARSGASSQSVPLTVTPRPDLPPTANAGSPQTWPVGTTVYLDGTGSSDPDGDLLTYNWSFFSTPLGSAATLTPPTSSQPSFVIDKSGTYMAQLIVNDGFLDSQPATVSISTLNSPPVAVATGPGQTVNAGTTVQLDGRNSFDPDGDPLTYTWSLLSWPVGSQAALSAPASTQPTFPADKAGTYVAQLIVNDGTYNSQPAKVTITAADTPPVAKMGTTLTLPESGLVPTSLIFQLGGYDPDGDSLTTCLSYAGSGAFYQVQADGVTQGDTIPQALLPGALVTNPNRLVKYVPAKYFFGTDYFDYILFDGGFSCSTGYVRSSLQVATAVPITVTHVEQPPVAVAATYQGSGTVQVTTIQLQFADPDPGDRLTVTITQFPANGKLYLDARVTQPITPDNPSFSTNVVDAVDIFYVYQTFPSYKSATDSFAYTVSDGFFTSAPATATILIPAAPLPPNPGTSPSEFFGYHDSPMRMNFQPVGSDLIQMTITAVPANGTLCSPNGFEGCGGNCTSLRRLLVDSPVFPQLNVYPVCYIPFPGYTNAGAPPDTFAYTLMDGSGWGAFNSYTVSMIVEPGVNEAPSFTFAGGGGTLVTPANPPQPYSLPWATNISPGLDDGWQTVNFIVTNNNAPLFSVPPAIDPNGVLTFTTSGLTGTATVTVRLHDNGGTANGGVDTSPPQTFYITVSVY